MNVSSSSYDSGNDSMSPKDAFTSRITGNSPESLLGDLAGQKDRGTSDDSIVFPLLMCENKVPQPNVIQDDVSQIYVKPKRQCPYCGRSFVEKLSRHQNSS